MICVALLLLILVIIVPAAFKSRISTIQNVNQGVDEFYDFIGSDFGPFSATFTGTASYGSPLYAAVYYPGAFGTALLAASDSVTLATFIFSSLQLQNASTDFQIRATLANPSSVPITTVNLKRAGAIGVFNATSGLESGTTLGVYFYWNGSISDNLICKVVTPSTISTFVTSYPVDYQDTYLRITINPSSTYFYINNVLAYTALHGANEFGATNMLMGLKDFKIDTSATQCGMTVDAIKLSQKPAIPRQFRNV